MAFNFCPGRAGHFARPGSREDQEFERMSGDAVKRPQLDHEGTNFGVWQGRMMRDLPGLLA
jgi:hypothetical protein